MPQLQASINRGKPDMANPLESRVILVLDRNGNAVPPVLHQHEHPPAGAVDHEGSFNAVPSGLDRRGLRIGIAPSAQDPRQPDGIGAGMLQPTELSGYQSASPDSSGQEQGELGPNRLENPREWRGSSPAPGWGPTGEPQSGLPLPSYILMAQRIRIVKNKPRIMHLIMRTDENR
jgi:hypothetical protein